MSDRLRYTDLMKPHCRQTGHFVQQLNAGKAARSALAVLGLIPLALLASCSSPYSPEVSLAGARLVERTSDATLLELDLDASNAGDEPLRMKDIAYEARTSDEVFTATRSAQAVIPPFSTRRVVLPVAIPRDLGDGPYTVVVQGRMVYVPNSVIRDTMSDLGWPSPSSPVGGDAVAEANASAATPPQGQ